MDIASFKEQTKYGIEKEEENVSIMLSSKLDSVMDKIVYKNGYKNISTQQCTRIMLLVLIGTFTYVKHF